ncbi:MAG: DnaD domain protein [Bacilli bacterium]
MNETTDLKASNELIPRRFGRVVVKEELVLLTGDLFKAIILNQFIYWSQRVRDFDRFLGEENARMKQGGQSANVSLMNGWIYKSAEELNQETFLGVSPQTIGRHVQTLIDRGYLLWRHNPDHGWDRTKQYRVDYVVVQKDLLKLGCALDGFALMESAYSKMEDASSTMNYASSKTEDGCSILEDRTVKSGRAIPESTTEITALDISTRAQEQGGTPDLPSGTISRQVTLRNQEEQKTALGQAVSGNNALALVTQAQAQDTEPAEVTLAPVDSPQPEQTPEEKAFGKIMRLYTDNKFKPSASFLVQDKLVQLIEEYGDTWVMGALQEALKHNGRSLGYIEAVLDGWREKGMAPWEKPRPVREARRDGSSLRQRNETASRGTAHVQPGKYDKINERFARLVQRE